MSTTAILSGRYLSIFTLTAAMAICQVRSALAVEGGTTSYPGGLETAYTGVVPAPNHPARCLCARICSAWL